VAGHSCSGPCRRHANIIEHKTPDDRRDGAFRYVTNDDKACGLAYSLYPYIVLDRLTIWEAAAAPSSLMFVFVGVAIVLPFTIAYTIFVYRVFHGKATSLSYGERD
jgi:hypothetical protein